MSEDELKLNNDLKEAIIKVIVFFDLFDYPLTAYEIWASLGKKMTLVAVLAELDRRTDCLEVKNGFYFLSGRAEIIATRQKRYNYASRKIKIARRFARLLQLWPFVKLIAVANSLGQYNLRDESDIDFFIVTAPGRLWLSRLYCTGLAKILQRRPSAKTKRDKICLSFYVSEEALDLSGLRLKGEDPYFDYWRRNLILLYNKDKTSERFLARNNSFGSEATAASSEPEAAERRAGGLENLAKKIQLKIMPPALRAAMNNSDGVVVSDSILKLYLTDNRRAYAEKYGKKIQEILGKNA